MANCAIYKQRFLFFFIKMENVCQNTHQRLTLTGNIDRRLPATSNIFRFFHPGTPFGKTRSVLIHSKTTELNLQNYSKQLLPQKPTSGNSLRPFLAKLSFLRRVNLYNSRGISLSLFLDKFISINLLTRPNSAGISSS